MNIYIIVPGTKKVFKKIFGQREWFSKKWGGMLFSTVIKNN